jgi:hypothetical protein
MSREPDRDAAETSPKNKFDIISNKSENKLIKSAMVVDGAFFIGISDWLAFLFGAGAMVKKDRKQPDDSVFPSEHSL